MVKISEIFSEERCMIALIGCVKSKNKGIHKACELYNSPLFKYQLEYAKRKTDKIYILSAKHGVLKLDDEIRDYEQTLNNMNDKQIKEWTFKVYNQLTKLNINKNDEILFLCGKKYYKYLSKIYINNQIPFENKPLGIRLSLLRKELNEIK